MSKEEYIFHILKAIYSRARSITEINGQLYVDDHLCQNNTIENLSNRIDILLNAVSLNDISQEELYNQWKKAFSNKVESSIKDLLDIGKKLKKGNTEQSDIILRWQKVFKDRLKKTLVDKFRYVDSFDNHSDEVKSSGILELKPILKIWPRKIIENHRWAYIESPLPQLPSMPLDEAWIDVQIIENEDILKLGNKHFLENLEEQYQNSQWLSYPADIIIEKLETCSVLIGNPGIGKTTLSKWLTRNIIKNPTGQFILPLFISLRSYAINRKHKPNLRILDFILTQCGVNSNEQIALWKSALDYLAGVDKENVILILDGWDEVPNEQQELIRQEITELTERFSILITSRPSAFPLSLPGDNFYQITELSPTNIFLLAKRWFVFLERPDLLDTLIGYLETNQSLEKLARNPFFLHLICSLLTHQSKLNLHLFTTKTEIYNFTIKQILSHHNKRYPQTPFHSEHLQQVEEFALWLMKDAPNAPQYLFEENDFAKVFGKIDLLDTILKPSRILNSWQTPTGLLEGYYFLHTTFQEFLASRKLEALNSLNIEKILEENILNRSWQEVFKFLSGRTVNQSFWSKMRELAGNPDLFGLIYIQIGTHLLEAKAIDGGKALLGMDIREKLWEGLIQGINSDAFLEVYKNLDSEHLIDNMNVHKSSLPPKLNYKLSRISKEIKTRKNREKLLGELFSEDEGKASVASYSLRNLLDTPTRDKLVSSLKNKSIGIKTKKHVVMALGHPNNTNMLDLLINTAREYPDLRDEVYLAISEIGGSKGINTIKTLFRESDSVEDKKCLISRAGNINNRLIREFFLELLAIVTKDDPLLPVILKALCETPIPQNSDILLVYTEETYPSDVRKSAILALKEARGIAANSKLLQIAKNDDDDNIRLTALETIHNRGNLNEVDWLSKRVQFDDCPLAEKANALKVLLMLVPRFGGGKILRGNYSVTVKKVFICVEHALQTPSGDLSLTAARYAYFLGEGIIPTLLKVLNTSGFDNSTYEATLKSLGKLSTPIVVEPLLKLITASDDLDHYLQETLSNEQKIPFEAAKAIINISPLELLNYLDNQTIKRAFAHQASQLGWLVYSDKIITPSGKALKPKIDTISKEELGDQIKTISAFLDKSELRMAINKAKELIHQFFPEKNTTIRQIKSDYTLLQKAEKEGVLSYGEKRPEHQRIKRNLRGLLDEIWV